MGVYQQLLELRQRNEALERENAVYEQAARLGLRALKAIATMGANSMDDLLKEKGYNTAYWRERKDHMEYLRTMDCELAECTVLEIDELLRSLRRADNS